MTKFNFHLKFKLTTFFSKFYFFKISTPDNLKTTQELSVSSSLTSIDSMKFIFHSKIKLTAIKIGKNYQIFLNFRKSIPNSNMISSNQENSVISPGKFPFNFQNCFSKDSLEHLLGKKKKNIDNHDQPKTYSELQELKPPYLDFICTGLSSPSPSSPSSSKLTTPLGSNVLPDVNRKMTPTLSPTVVPKGIATEGLEATPSSTHTVLPFPLSNTVGLSIDSTLTTPTSLSILAPVFSPLAPTINPIFS